MGNSCVVSKLPTEAKMGDMEIVRQFNSEVSVMSCRRVFNENHLLRGFESSLPLLDKLVSFDLYFQLSTIYETKPPISKAKVASVTRLAVKAIKVCFVFIYNKNNRKETL